jgi:exodeoxyribonuclease III
MGPWQTGPMRIATWNVNSLKQRLPKVTDWLPQHGVDVLLMQETKLADEAAPEMPFRMAGYELAHHGEGRWNGVAIASRVGLADVQRGFGENPDPDGARFISAVCDGVRVASIYAPNGRQVGSEFWAAKLAWYGRLRRWLDERDPQQPLVLGGDFNVAPTDLDVWDPAAFEGATHVTAEERAAFASLLAWGLVDAYRACHPEGGRFSWWDYRAGSFHKGQGMRIDHLLATRPLAARVVAAEIDREARKNPIPSDHAPVILDLDAAPGSSSERAPAPATF